MPTHVRNFSLFHRKSNAIIAIDTIICRPRYLWLFKTSHFSGELFI